MEDSLTAFVKRTLGLDPGGRTIRTVKDQLTRLSAADFRIGTVLGEGRAVTLKGSVIEGFALWTSRDPQQRVLLPTMVHFSLRYFESLMKRAVPLNETAVARLSHSAMALDDFAGQTALEAAVRQHLLSSVPGLIAHGADVNRRLAGNAKILDLVANSADPQDVAITNELRSHGAVSGLATAAAQAR